MTDKYSTKQKARDYSYKYYKNNTAKQHLAGKKYRDKLSDGYIKALLKQSGALKITQDMIEKKREYIIRLRAFKDEEQKRTL